VIAATPVKVPSWAWTLSTTVTALLTLVLVLVLGLHVFIAAVPHHTGRRPLGNEVRLRRRLRRAAVPLLALLIVAVVVRFGFILAERPGP
jgi:hypothetical protein